MTSINILRLISNESERLYHFAEMNGRASVRSFVEIESRRPQLAHHAFIPQIRLLNERITAYLNADRAYPPRNVTLLNHQRALERAQQGAMADLAHVLRDIHQFAQSIFFPVLPVEEIEPQLGFVDPRRWQARVDAERARNFAQRDQEIFHAHSARLSACDWMVDHLSGHSPRWREIFDDSDPEAFEIFPGLIEGYLIQKSASYQSYREMYENFLKEDLPFSLTEDEYLTIRGLSFLVLAEEILKDPPSPSMVRLRTLGLTLRSQSERLISLSLSRQEEIARQRAISIEQIDAMQPEQIEEEIQKAIQSESVVFLSKLIDPDRIAFRQMTAEQVGQLVVWLAAREHTDLLGTILEYRSNQLREENYLHAIEAADFWGWKENCEKLISTYLQVKGAKAKGLLFFCTGQSLFWSLSYLLSAACPHRFRNQSIEEAFQLALNMRSAETMLTFFENGKSQILSADLLERAWDEICHQGRFECAQPLFVDDSIGRMPDAIRRLREAFIETLVSGNLDGIDFFFDPMVSPHLNRPTIYDGFRRLSNHELDVRVLLDSPLFNRLTASEVCFLMSNALEKGKTNLAIAYLDSSRGGEISKTQFELSLSALATRRQWDILSRMLDYPRYLPLSQGRLNHYLAQASQNEAPVETVGKILSKGNSFDNQFLVQCMTNAMREGNIEKMRCFMNHGLHLTTEEITNLLEECFDGERIDMAYCLLAHPDAKAISGKTLGLSLIEGARGGDATIVSPEWDNIASVPPEDFEEAFFAAIAEGHVEYARAILAIYPIPEVDQEVLHMATIQAAFSNALEVLKFLEQCFSEQFPASLGTAEATARSQGHHETAAYLWNRIWHSAPIESGERSSKRSKKQS